MSTRHPRSHSEEPRSEGIGSFLRNLITSVPWSECAESSEEMIVAAPSGGRIKINNGNGRTRVIGENRDDISIQIHKRARAESPDAADELLEAILVETSDVSGSLVLDVQTPRRWNRHGHAHLELRVPCGTHVLVEADNGKVCVEGMRSSVSAHSRNGSVRISDVIGDVEITTSNAKVSCNCTCGRLLARSTNGRIELADHRGSVDATTSNGLIRASLEELSDEGVVLATSNGRIVLDLPKDVDAEVDLRVENGVIRTLRELHTKRGDSTGRLRGRLGRGGKPVKLRTSNGTISLR
jgi:ribosomal protein S27E